MYLKDFLLIFRQEYRQVRLIRKIWINDAYKERRMTSRIILNCHSIEKGLSLKKPRPGFGKQKVDNILSLIEEYQRCGYDMNHISIKMAFGVLKEYMIYQQGEGEIDPLQKSEIEKIIPKAYLSNNVKTGGTQRIIKKDIMQNDKKEFEHLITTRHSIRDFLDEEISLEDIKEAVKFALRAPSACNRQPSRVYITDKTQREIMSQYLDGVGGFEASAQNYLIITSDMSAYPLSEKNQWIVSTGIFIGYLSLALHSCGLGACIIQRELYATKVNQSIAKEFNIPEEEQIICVICIGKYPETFNVPISIRYDVEDIIKVLK
ncbi:nitroreductase family protein [Dehalobacter sp. TeCB1]|uniref:nitroreductase family protein n=1 Tax=Dehalobacter sp. TeCB1 TaxID=1843715 RepID=UPI000839ECA6|nr:nitroreductase family protein [Dehalobacter sp. TeCB1]OCZ49441.1 hypothetical protein A7D23_03015 [Dehalobacter sp. TeCB1]